jgi:hypothetical protein
MRKAGSAVLGIIAEGCSDRIREILSDILPKLLQLIQDPEYYVRECACFALGLAIFTCIFMYIITE